MAKNKKRRNVKSKRAFRLNLKKGTVYSIAQILFFSLAVLSIVSFSRRGLILVSANDFLVDNFSWTAVFLPFLFISFALLVSKFKSPLGSPNTVVGGILFFVSLMSLARAGRLGTMIWESLSALITPAGSVILLLATTIVGLVILFNTSLDQVFFLVVGMLKNIKGFVVADKRFMGQPKKDKQDKFIRGDIKVSGAGIDSPGDSVRPAAAAVVTSANSTGVPQELIKNNPGDEKAWKYPPTNILSDDHSGKADRGDIKNNATIIEETLESFGITARVVEVNLGPAVTQYAIEVALGTKLSKITNLERDLALALAAPTGTIRIEAPIPGRSLVGIELPNISPEFVSVKKMMESDTMKKLGSKLALSMGLDVSGNPVVTDLGRMPHMLIAGQTGSGKSVCINAFLSTILFRSSPAEVKLILVDPKRVELTGYNGIPHLLSPVIVEPEKVLSALRWLTNEMDNRYKLFAEAGARNIESFNEMSGFQALPYIILFVDELADIMLFAPAEVEDTITRLAQMSRATGIHMILSTQRPSVNVITGLIKANIPARVAFAVSSQIDSRVILDGQGAEKLLGKGDMLFLPPDKAKPTRIQGAYISDKEIRELVGFLKNQGVDPQYTEEVTNMQKAGSSTITGVDGDVDEYFADAVKLVIETKKASASYLQRRFSIGYARAARLLDQLEAAGVVSAADGSKPREILITDPDQVLGQKVPSQELS